MEAAPALSGGFFARYYPTNPPMRSGGSRCRAHKKARAMRGPDWHETMIALSRLRR